MSFPTHFFKHQKKARINNTKQRTGEGKSDYGTGHEDTERGVEV